MWFHGVEMKGLTSVLKMYALITYDKNFVVNSHKIKTAEHNYFIAVLGNFLWSNGTHPCGCLFPTKNYKACS